jgi:hypothetical protein
MKGLPSTIMMLPTRISFAGFIGSMRLNEGCSNRAS